ncbi:MAG: hypothetical protein KIT11_10505 [Fimbriimonadaceae bacterium]|nr:hypothetical protein [Fimbriimonadaceae bacterium]QYK55752.1 MAG: hypothetical protein KF733_12175 [Fimbriimonadaceae bacterium]
MTTLALALALARFDPADHLFQKAIAAYKEFEVGAVVMKRRSKGWGGPETVEMTYRFIRGKGAALRLFGKESTEFIATQPALYEVAHASQKYYVEEAKGQRVVAGLRSMASWIEPVATMYEDPDAVATWFKEIGPPADWRPSRAVKEPGFWLEKKTPEALLRIAFDLQTGYLTAFESTGSLSSLSYTFIVEPRQPDEIRLGPPMTYAKSAYPRFTIVPPVYGSKDAQRTAEKLFKLYEQPKKLAYKSKRSGEVVDVYVMEGKVRMVDSLADWAYDGKRLTMLDKKAGVLVTGEAKMAEAAEAPSKAGTRLETLLQTLARGENPMRLIYGNHSQINYLGTTTIDGEKAAILRVSYPPQREVSGSQDTMTLIIAERDGFLFGASSAQAQKLGGAAMATRYSRIPMRPADLAVAAPKDARKQPLATYLSTSPPRPRTAL